MDTGKLTASEEHDGVQLRLSAQRAPGGHMPASLRSVSLEVRGRLILFRAVFEPGATEADRELLSSAAAEIIADYPSPTTINEELVELAPPEQPSHFRYLVFLRAEPERACRPEEGMQIAPLTSGHSR